jgi:regulatory protein
MSSSKKIPFEWVLEKAKKICSKQEKCVCDIRQKLQAWEVEDADIERVIDVLLNENFIDEKRYAAFFAADKLRFNRWGKQKIAYALRQKGVDQVLIGNALKELDEAEYKKMIDEELKKKCSQIHCANKNKMREKIFRFAQNRGYEQDYIYQFINTI